MKTWKNIKNRIKYIGSAIDLSIRFRSYNSKAYLICYNYSYTYNALRCQGYSIFSLSIIEIIDISNLSKEKTWKSILEREQYYISSLNPKYYINLIVESRLGSTHSEESFVKFSEVNHPMYGKSYSSEVQDKINKALTSKITLESTKAKISKVHISKTFSEKTKLKISKALIGKVLTEATKTKISKANISKTFLKLIKEKTNISKGITIYIYTSDKFLIDFTFDSYC